MRCNAKRRAIDLLDPAALLRAVSLQVTPVVQLDSGSRTQLLGHSSEFLSYVPVLTGYMPTVTDPVPSVTT